METELTPDEQVALHQAESATKWDIITMWLSVLLPCMLIGAVGIWNKSMSVVASAGLAFVIIVLIGMPKQIRQQASLKSAVQKLKNQAVANKASEDIAAGAPNPQRSYGCTIVKRAE